MKKGTTRRFKHALRKLREKIRMNEELNEMDMATISAAEGKGVKV